MKIAFPTNEDKGLQSPVYGHFGSAPFFIVVDAESEELTVLGNQDLSHTHGNCQPLQALGGTAVDAVVVGGIGGGALRKLFEADIRTYRAVEGTVSDNLTLFRAEKLPPFTMEHTCQGHQGIGECVH
jgi:predicted Fe-Mo cluster-binding NifX family protein